jgi:hypothetical protein
VRHAGQRVSTVRRLFSRTLDPRDPGR